MSIILYITLPIVLIAVLISLALGLRSLAGGELEDRKRSNRLMQWRVGLQGAAIAIILAIIALGS